MKTRIQQVLANINFGSAQSFRGVTIFPLFVAGLDAPDYLTLRQALAVGVLEVTEISKGGSVPELAVVSNGTKSVLLLDGEELRGAKQNRVLNTTILVEPGTRVIIPVSCTEQGRWSYVSAAFADSEEVLAQGIRSAKARSVSDNLKAHRSYRSDQGAVWAGIADLHRDLGTSSPTGAMRDAFEARRDDLQTYENAFHNVEGMQGLLVYRNGQLGGLDLLSSAEAFADLFPKLLRSYLVETLDNAEEATAAVTPEQARQFLDQAADCQETVFDSPGLGKDVRLESADTVGSALMVDGELVHLALFPKGNRRQKIEHDLADLSRRRRFRSGFRVE